MLPRVGGAPAQDLALVGGTHPKQGWGRRVPSNPTIQCFCDSLQTPGPMQTHHHPAEEAAGAQREPKQDGSAETSPKELCSHIHRRKGLQLLVGTESTTENQPSSHPQGSQPSPKAAAAIPPALGWHQGWGGRESSAGPPDSSALTCPTSSPAPKGLARKPFRGTAVSRGHQSSEEGQVALHQVWGRGSLWSPSGHCGTEKAQKCCSTLLL